MIGTDVPTIGDFKNKTSTAFQKVSTRQCSDCLRKGTQIRVRKLEDLKKFDANPRNGLSVKGFSQGYVTTAVVSTLAILSLFATRNMIVATVDNFRSAGYSQALTTSLYAAEVALQDTVSEMENRSGLDTASSCFEVTLSNVEIDTDLEATASYRAEPLGATTVGSETRYLFRVYVTAIYRVASATVSQIVSVELGSTNTVYILPATWTDRLAPCALP